METMLQMNEITFFYWVGYVFCLTLLFAVITIILSISTYVFWQLVISKSYNIFNDWKISRKFCFENAKQFDEWKKKFSK